MFKRLTIEQHILLIRAFVKSQTSPYLGSGGTSSKRRSAWNRRTREIVKLFDLYIEGLNNK